MKFEVLTLSVWSMRHKQHPIPPECNNEPKQSLGSRDDAFGRCRHCRDPNRLQEGGSTSATATATATSTTSTAATSTATSG